MELISEEIKQEIRDEVKNAAANIHQVAGDAYVHREKAVYSKIAQVFEKMMQLESIITRLPTPGDFEPIFKQIRSSEQASTTNSNDLAERVDRGIEKMNQQVNTAVGQLLLKLEDQVNRSDAQSQQAEKQMQGSVQAVQQQVSAACSGISGEVQKVQQQDTAHYKTLEQACADLNLELVDGMRKVTAEVNQKIGESESTMEGVLRQLGSQVQRLEDKVQRCESKLSSEVSNVQVMLNGSSNNIVSEIQKMQKQGDKHHTDFSLSLESQLAMQQESSTVSLQEALADLDFEPIHDALVRNRKTAHMDLKTLLGEVSRVQQALHIDYVQMSAPPEEFVAPANSVARAAKRKTMANGQPAADQKRLTFAAASPNLCLDDEDPELMKDSIAALSLTRVREFFTQTIAAPTKDTVAQTDPMVDKEGEERKLKKKKRSKEKGDNEEGPKKAAFAGADRLKENAKANSMKPPYNVFDYYHDTGVISMIAKSQAFDYLTLFVVLCNALWIAVDVDRNDEAILIKAALPFIIAENLFCLFFSVEIIIRFCAFQKKINALKDPWFVFDMCLVLLMVGETWVFTLVIVAFDLDVSGGAGGFSVFRMVRVVKLLRLSRMARLLRAVPELVIIMKGLGFAARSVSIFFLLCIIIVYVFAVLFRQLTDGDAIGQELFPSVPHAMDTLLLNAIFPDSSGIISKISGANIWLWPIIVFFFSLVSVTIMYMLVGVLVDVVGLVATVEKEGLEVSYLAGLLRNELENLGYKADSPISQFEFQNLMLEPSIVKIVAGAGVDVIVLADMMDLLMEDILKQGGSITFPGLMEIVLSMRGSNPATVKDFKEQIKMFKVIMNEAMEEGVKKIKKEIGNMKAEAQDLDSDDDEGEPSTPLVPPLESFAARGSW